MLARQRLRQHLPDMQKLLSSLPLILALLPGMSRSATVESMDLPEPAVQIDNQGGTLVMDISYRVPVSLREAWTVLTDFDHMAEFVPNLESSKVLMRSGTSLQVEQEGSIRLGILPFHYETTRQVDVVPYQSIRSHTLSGNTRLESSMVLTPAGDGTLLSYHATAVPDLPVPGSLVGSYLSRLLESQFKAMSREMLRRAQLDKTNDDHEPIQQAQQSTTPVIQQTAAKKTAKAAIKQSQLTSKKPRSQTKKRPG